MSNNNNNNNNNDLEALDDQIPNNDISKDLINEEHQEVQVGPVTYPFFNHAQLFGTSHQLAHQINNVDGLNHSNANHLKYKAARDMPLIFKEKQKRYPIKNFVNDVLNTSQPNITQIALLHFFFNFYYGLYTLTSIDIIRLNFASNNIMKSYSLIYLLSGITSFFGNTIIGALSDKFGRKPFLIASIAVRIISQLFLFFEHNVLFLYSTAFFCFIDVGNSLIMVATADVTDHEDRDKGYAIVSAMQPLGFILGPIVSSIISHNSGENQSRFFLIITYISFFISMMTLAYVYFIVPESLNEELQKKAKLDLNKMNPFHNISIALCNRSFFMVLCITALIVLPQETIQSTYTMFLKNYLELSDYVTSIIIATIALSTTLFLAFFFEYLIEILTHRVTIVVATIVQIIVMILSSYLTSVLFLIFNGIMMSFAYISYPALCSLVSLSASTETLGVIMGIITAVRQIIYAILPFIVLSLNNAFNIDFGSPIDRSRICIAPSYFILGLISILAIPFLYFLGSNLDIN